MSEIKEENYEKNICDFRSELVSLCGKSKKLNGHSICVLTSNTYLKEAVETAFLNHGAVIDDKKTDWVVFFSDFSTTSPKIRDNAKIITIDCTGTTQKISGSIYTDILCPKIVGVGLTDDYPEPIDSSSKAIYVSDLIDILIRLISTEAQGLFYIEGDYEADEKRQIIHYNPKISVEKYNEICSILKAYPNRRFYFDNSVNGELQKLQKLQVTILSELDRICKENDISYYLCGGTLLGAIREHGFIPWDDDIDVIMDRKNFNKLKAIAAKTLDPRFFYQDSKSDPSYHSPFAKIRLLGTSCATKFSSQFPEMHNEVFIDIFAQDKACNNPKICKQHFRLVGIVRTMTFHKWAGKMFSIKGKHRLLYKFANLIIKHSSINTLERIRDFVLTFWNNTNSNLLYDSMGVPFRRDAFTKDCFSEAIEVMFEGKLFPAPKGYDQYLRINYGDDYMEWPTPTKRINHHIYVDVSLDVSKEN